MTQIQAAKAGGYSIREFDDLDMYRQAEAVASFLVDSRIAEVMSHRARRASSKTNETDPFENEDG